MTWLGRGVAAARPAYRLRTPGRWARVPSTWLGAGGHWLSWPRRQTCTRTYRSKTMVDQLAKFRACFENKLGDIQDKTGTHPKWQDVDAANLGKWDVYAFTK